jgi:hypothetical protein
LQVEQVLVKAVLVETTLRVEEAVRVQLVAQP